MTTIGVVGYGTVGRAVSHGFIDRGFKVYVNEARKTVLPTDNYSKKYLLENCDVVFLCVPTPLMLNASIDLGYLIHVLNEFQDIVDTQKYVDLPLLVIKSTVMPGTTDGFDIKYPMFKFAVNPEFLRVQSASKDFLNPDRIIVGASATEDGATVLRLYDSWDCYKVVTTSTTAELIKCLSNAYLVMKVAFACEMQKLIQHFHASSYFTFKGVTSDNRIQCSHLDPDLGRIPSDSPCLPKDLYALINSLNDDGVDTSFLQGIFYEGVQL